MVLSTYIITKVDLYLPRDLKNKYDLQNAFCKFMTKLLQEEIKKTEFGGYIQL